MVSCSVKAQEPREWELPLKPITLILESMPAAKIAQYSCISSAWKRAAMYPNTRGKVTSLLGSMLHEPVKCGRVEKVKYLLSAGASADIKGIAGMTALHSASLHGHVMIVKIILAAGAKIDERDDLGRTALMWAASRGWSDVVQLLIGAGAKLDAEADNGWTALMEAAWGGHLETFYKLINAGAHVKEVGCDEDFLGIVGSCKDEVANSLVLKLVAQLVSERDCPVL